MKHGGILVFIDDSGDPGLSTESSPVFVIALVIFDDTLVAEETALAIKKLRRELHFPDDVEFKFHKSRLPIKTLSGLLLDQPTAWLIGSNMVWF
jgi:hypothetical protein